MDLPGGLEKRRRLDVAHRPADLSDDDVGNRRAVGRVRLRPHSPHDFVRDMRDDLHGIAQVLAASLPRNHRRVDLPGGDVRATGERFVQETLVVPNVEVGFRPVLRHKHLAVLEGVHRAGVDVDVGVELLHRHRDPSRLEEHPQRGGR